MVCLGEGFLGDSAFMVVRPAPDFRVEQSDQVFLFRLFFFLHCFPDVIKKRFYVLLGRLDQQLAAVLAYIPSEKIKPFVDMRDLVFSGESVSPRSARKLSTNGLTSFPAVLWICR